jgi:hypothetical protein
MTNLIDKNKLISKLKEFIDDNMNSVEEIEHLQEIKTLENIIYYIEKGEFDYDN